MKVILCAVAYKVILCAAVYTVYFSGCNYSQRDYTVIDLVGRFNEEEERGLTLTLAGDTRTPQSPLVTPDSHYTE